MIPRLALIALLSPAAAHAASWESFELGTTQWSSSDEGGRLDAHITRDVASEGTHSFGGRVEIKTLADNPKAGFFLQPDANFSQIDDFHFDIYNGTRTTWSAKLIMQTGPSWDWNELELGELKPGWNKGIGCDFRTQMFNKDHPTKLQHPELIAKMQILMVPKEPTQGGLYLDNLKITGPGAEALSPQRLPGAREFLANDFEGRDSGWKAVADAALTVSPDNEFYSKGQQGLKLETFSKNPDQSANFGMERAFNLTNVQSMTMDVYNPGGHSLLSVGVAYGPDWSYAESPANRLRPGWNYNVTFDFQSKNFKCAANGWKNSSALPDMVAIRRVSLVYAPGQFGAGGVVIDNLRVRAVSEADAAQFKAPEEAAGLITPWENLGGAATPKSDFSDALSVGSSSTFVSTASDSLRLGYKLRSNSTVATFQLLKPMDLTGVRGVDLDVYNPSDSPVEMAMAFSVGDSSEWFESRGARLSPGWNDGVRIKLDGPVFKSAASQWAYSAELPSRKSADIQSAYLQVGQGALGDNSLYLARMDLIRRPDLSAIGIPMTVQGGYQLDLKMDTAAYTLWDTGISEGGFEKGLGAWQGAVGAGSALSVLRQSQEFSSEGSKSMRVDFRGNGSSSMNAVVVYNTTSDPAHPLPDLSEASRLRLDIYNPGAPLGFNVAFAAGASSQYWYESLPVVLKSGWNRNVTVELDGPTWKVSLNNLGTPFYNNELPKDLRKPGMLQKLNLQFHGARAGSVYLDNIRIGKPGSASDLGGQASLGLHFFGGEHFEVEAAGSAGSSQDGSAWALPGLSRVKLRGAGQQLALSFGAPLDPFDDAMSVFTGKSALSSGYSTVVQGNASVANDSLAALQYSGSFLGLQLRGAGAVPWYSGSYSPGQEFIGALRATAPLGGLGSLGGTFVEHRFGYDDGASLALGQAEQQVEVGELDGSFHLPLGLNVSGGYGQTTYALDKTLYILKDASGLPVLFSDVPDPKRNGWMIEADTNISAFSLSADYWVVDQGFYTVFSDKLYNATKLDSKVVTKFEGFDAIRLAAEGDSWGKALLHGMSLTLEYDTFSKADGSYDGKTPQIRFENGGGEKLGYVLMYSAKLEEKTDLVSGYLTSTSTPDALALVRISPWTDGRVSLGLRNTPYVDPAENLNYAQTILGVVATQRLFKKLRLSAAYGIFNVGFDGDQRSYGDAYAGLAYDFSGWLGGTLEFGRKPFGDDELGMNWLQTDPRIAFTLKGSF